MTRHILCFVPATVLIAGALFANQAAAFGFSGSFPPDVLSGLLIDSAAAVSQTVTTAAPLPGS